MKSISITPDDEQRRSQDHLVLVADDEEPIRFLWERYLSRWGYTVDLAENGKTALEKAREKQYDLVITDLAMPEMSGNELVHILKKEQPELEIIVTTGFGTIEVAVEMMKAGAHEFITKPISFKHAEQIILKCMSQAEAHKENLMLREMNKDLEELNRVKEKFIAITNHELRSPVSLITNVSEMLEQIVSDGQIVSMVKMISRASGQLTEIVTQMHELTQASSGKLELQLGTFNFVEMCDEIVSEFELAISDRQHQVTVDFDSELSVRGDRVKLKKVVRELLQNAIKFTKNGGLISISGDDSNSGHVDISITDNGIGISESEQESIFQMFYEVAESRHHSTSDSDFQGGGMGIGLAIVDDIIKAHKGKITLRSTLNEGSTFIVTLPR